MLQCPLRTYQCMKVIFALKSKIPDCLQKGTNKKVNLLSTSLLFAVYRADYLSHSALGQSSMRLVNKTVPMFEHKSKMNEPGINRNWSVLQSLALDSAWEKSKEWNTKSFLRCNATVCKKLMCWCDVCLHPLFIYNLWANFYPCLCTHDHLHEVHRGTCLQFWVTGNNSRRKTLNNSAANECKLKAAAKQFR